MIFRFVAALCLVVCLGQAQQRFPMEEIDEIGHMDSEFDERKVADLGLAKAYPEQDGEGLRIEGFDDGGKPWTAHMKNFGHVGWTRVFAADFDANGRQDLLFLQWSMRNGRCIDEMYVTTFLFDEDGRPIPWKVETHGMGDNDELITLLDQNGDGKAELATSGCRYSDEPRHGEDRRLTGIYGAGDARWRPQQPLSISPYVLRFQQERPHTGDFIVWEEPDDVWSDPHAGWDGEERYLEAMSGSGHKAVLHFQDGASSPIADGVVLDGPAGREIFLTETEAAHRRALTAGAAVRLLGDGDRPTLLWARLGSGSPLDFPTVAPDPE